MKVRIFLLVLFAMGCAKQKSGSPVTYQIEVLEKHTYTSIAGVRIDLYKCST